MNLSKLVARVVQRGQGAVVGAVLFASVALALPQPVQALTIVLNFVNASTTDRNGVTSIPETFSA